MQDAEFERLVRRHAQSVYAFLVYRTGDHHLADDILADTLERAYRSRGRFDRRRGSEKTWLMSIAVNRWRDLVRRSVTEQAAIATLGERGEPPPWVEAVEDRRTLLAALAELPADERDVVTLAYGADLSAKQVAAVLDLPLTTVHGRLYRGLERLRGTLAEHHSWQQS